MRNIILFFIITSITFSCSTIKQKNECNKVLDNELLFVNNSNKSEFEKDYKILENCGKLDSIDKIIFSPQTIGTLMIGQVSKNDKLTYRIILNEINKIRNTEEYSTQKEILYQSEKLKTKIINIDEWEKDKLILENIGMKGERLKSFKIYISQFENSNKTYETAFLEFNETASGKEFIDQKNKPFVFKDFENYEKVLKTAKIEKKKVLLFFTGYGDVNSRKMEENILIDSEIKSILTENYLAYSLFVDSRKKLNKNEVYTSKRNNKLIETIGKKFSEFQMEKFKVNRQPYFVIIDEKGKIFKEQGYTREKNEFLKFLTLKN